MTKAELTVAIEQELTSLTPELTDRLRKYHRIETDTAYAVAVLDARRAAARIAGREHCEQRRARPLRRVGGGSTPRQLCHLPQCKIASPCSPLSFVRTEHPA